MTVLGRVAAALLSMLLTLVALDRAIKLFDLACIPTRGRRNDVRRIDTLVTSTVREFRRIAGLRWVDWRD
jgi:hypothetical protein